MYILCDGNWDRPEIEISDLSQNLIRLGGLLLSINGDFKLQANPRKSEFYPENLEAVSMRLIPSTNAEELDLLKVFIDNKNLVIEGSKLGFYKLGSSLVNCFTKNSQSGKHFHLHYVQGDRLLAPTNCSLIFLCNSQFH